MHKDLVKTGRWPNTLGDDYDTLMDLRELADYGALQHAETEDAQDAIASSERLLRAVHQVYPDVFPMDEG